MADYQFPVYTWPQINSLLGVVERGVVTFPFFIPMSGVADSTFNLTGSYRTIETSETGNFTTSFAMNNNHLVIKVNSITTMGTVTVTGDRWDEATGTLTEGDTEVITISSTDVDAMYQTLKKWQVVTLIDVSGTTGLNYDIESLGYFDAANRPFSVRGYRMDVKTASSTADLRQTITAVKNRGGNLIELVVLDDIGFDSTTSNGILYDHVREDPAGYYTAPVNLVSNNEEQVFKRTDIDTYIGADSDINGDNNEGILVSYSGEPGGGLSGIDHVTLYLSFGNQT